MSTLSIIEIEPGEERQITYRIRSEYNLNDNLVWPFQEISDDVVVKIKLSRYFVDNYGKDKFFGFKFYHPLEARIIEKNSESLTTESENRSERGRIKFNKEDGSESQVTLFGTMLPFQGFELIWKIDKDERKVFLLDGLVLNLLNLGKDPIQIYEEINVCYVSEWSKFFLCNLPHSFEDMSVCDFGAGTGIFSIIAAKKGAQKIRSIEREESFRRIMKENFENNNVNNKIKISKSSDGIDPKEHYDYIVCNPSCYPSAVGTESFYHAGEKGLDMIMEVIVFASKTLKKDGRLLMMCSSITPVSVALSSLKDFGLLKIDHKYQSVELREHLRDKIKKWVYETTKEFPEVQIFTDKEKGISYERVDLYEIKRIDES